MKIAVNNIIVPLNADQNNYLYNELNRMGIKKDDILELKYAKRSIDSRKKSDIKLVYNLDLTIKDSTNIPNVNTIIPQKNLITKVRKSIFNKNIKIAIIGTGPAGLFAAYRLCQYGYSPIIFERGETIDERDKTIETFINFSILNPDSNIQFGEGGAGTYSDGKLNTRVKSGYINDVFKVLLECGAQQEIEWDYKPHIGTDILKVVIKNLREKIKNMGGRFYFNTKLIDISSDSLNTIKTITLKSKDGYEEILDIDKLILATGHSARDTYLMLNKRGVAMENKPFAVGSRIEHPREFINELMFGKESNNPLLGTATYSLTHNNKEKNRGIFSFCMCPGGVIVNATSEEKMTLVNGMSYSDRKRPFSNSALVVSVSKNEFGNELFSGMKFQENIESKAYKMAGGYGGVYQNTTDFIKGNKSKKISSSSYEMKLISENLDTLLPEFITSDMKMALNYWNKIYKGFVSREANLIGPETRTSSPIQILRDLKGESISIKGLFPIGEGAGYAGGITSAAVDSFKIIDLSFTREED